MCGTKARLRTKHSRFSEDFRSWLYLVGVVYICGKKSADLRIVGRFSYVSDVTGKEEWLPTSIGVIGSKSIWICWIFNGVLADTNPRKWRRIDRADVRVSGAHGWTARHNYDWGYSFSCERRCSCFLMVAWLYSSLLDDPTRRWRCPWGRVIQLL